MIFGVVMNLLWPMVHGPWLFSALAVILALGAVYAIVDAWTSRWRLLPDRVEAKGLFGVESLSRAKIVGFRVEPQDHIRLESVDGRKHGLSVPMHVAKNPVWAAWFETLENLDAVAFNQELAILEKDPRLGANPTARLETLGSLRKLTGRASLVGIGLACWLLFYPHPYGPAVAINVVTPLIALAVANRWRGLVSLMGDQGEEPTISLMAFWFMPSLILALRALLDIDKIDWIQPLCAGLGLAAIPFLFALRAQRVSPKSWATLFLALFLAVVTFCWGWGTISLANWWFDKAPPAIQRAVVVHKGGSADDDPTLSLRAVDAGANLPLIEDLKVSKARFEASRVGGVACVAIYPGWLGWRYVAMARCPAAAH
ncbi:hypothetical protein ASD21_03395 [Caulobacter sp. Root1455]|jgi:hypothetical protein|nr:hypothetical protein ASD21_03395 [Caulobacter sp. Root1455]